MTTGMNAFICSPYSGFTMTLGAWANTTYVGAYCNWSCDCGVGSPPHVTINNSDGLPVELLEFEVDGNSETP